MSTVKKSKLRKARALISDPKNWCRGTYAMNAKGTPTSAFNRDAAMWCISGACSKVGVRSRMLDLAALYLYAQNSAILVNDHCKYGHADVMNVFDLAIALEEVGE